MNDLLMLALRRESEDMLAQKRPVRARQLDRAANEIERLTAEVERLESSQEQCCGMNPEGVADLEMRYERLTAELDAANARECKAYFAGWNEGVTGDSGDEEQAWQQYRCQDDSDWVATASTHQPQK